MACLMVLRKSASLLVDVVFVVFCALVICVVGDVLVGVEIFGSLMGV